MASYLDDWTEEQVEVAGELGFDEMERRTEKLHRYYKWDTVATIYGDRTLTPEQAIAWAKFAQTLGKDHVINNTEIQKPKSLEEQMLQVVKEELDKREAGEKDS
jgi:hypothetical protein